MAAKPSALPEDHISFPYVCARRHRTRLAFTRAEARALLASEPAMLRCARCGARAAMQGECADLLRRFAAQR